MTKVLILAAGQGTRLRPLTNDKPKCLVQLLGNSLLERQVNTLKSCGVDTIHIATGYREDQIRNLGFDTTLNPKYASTNMVETLFCASEYMVEGEDLIIAYGDIVYQKGNLKELLNCSEEIALMVDKNWKSLWSLRLENPLDDAETLKLDKGFVTELGKKPISYSEIEGQYTGLIKIRGDKIKEFKDFYLNLDRTASYDGQDFFNMYMTSFLQMLINSGWKAKAVEVEGGWLEIDSVDDLDCYEDLYHQGKLSEFYVL